MTREEKVLQLKQDFDEVYDAGKQAEYDAFWDTYQRNGIGLSYLYMFSGGGWRDAIYNPKYPIKILYNCNYMYFNSNITNTKVSIDISGLTSNLMYMFASSKIETIPLLIVDEATAYGNTIFNACASLINLTIQGTIAKKGLDLQWSTNLSRASIISVINALSTTTSGLSVTFSKTAKEAAFTDDEWAVLIATKPNWAINLV